MSAMSASDEGAATTPSEPVPAQSAATSPTTSAATSTSADAAAGEPEPPAAPAASKPAPSASDDSRPRSDDAPEPARGAERTGGNAGAPAVLRAEAVQSEIDATNAKPAAEAHAEPRAGAGRGAEAPPPGERIAQPPAHSTPQPAAPAAAQRGEPTPIPVRADAETPTPLLSRGLAALAAQKGGTMQIRLDPPSLGDVRIELTIRQGAVVAEITASSASTQSLLARELGALHGALERQGLLVERLTVHAPPQRAAESQALPTPTAADAGRGESNAQRGGDGGQQRSGDGRHDAGDGASRGRREHDSGGEPGQRRRTPRASFARIWSEVEV